MSEDYFNKVVPLRLQSSDKDERRCLVRVKVALGWSSSSTHRKDLTVQLTDDDEPYFFFYVSISEDDFHGLKSQQGLRVDFASFPHNVVNLLENCLRESSSDEPKFLLHLVCGSGSSAQLEMIETNPFKHLTHLSLKLVAGSDAALKKHLAQCVKVLKEEKTEIQERFTTCQADLSRAQQLLEERTRQLASVRAESSSEVAQLVSAHGAEISRLKEESKQALSSAEEKLEQSRFSAQEAHGEMVRRLEKQAQLLSESVQRITDDKSQALDNLRQARQELAISLEQRQSASSSLDDVKSSKAHLESDVRDKSSKIGTLAERVSQLEHQLHDNEMVVKKTTQMMETAVDQKDSALSALTGQQGLCAHLEEKVESLTAEVAKGNEIIKRMHQELRECKTKIKNRNLLAVEQEKLLSSKEADLQQQYREVERLANALRAVEAELGSVRSAKVSLDSEVARIQEELQKSQNVISYLNRQVTEHRLGQHQGFETAAPPAMSSALPAATTSASGDGSALGRPFVAASWTAAGSAGGHAVETSGFAAAARVEAIAAKAPPVYGGRQPLNHIQPPVSAYTTALQQQDQGNFGAVPKRSAIPVPASKAQQRGGVAEPSRGARKDSEGSSKMQRSGAAGAATSTMPVVSMGSASAGALGPHGGLDPRYLQGSDRTPASAYSQENTAAAGIAGTGKAAGSFSSVYFPH